MGYILRLSYGKNSLACWGAIEQLGWRLDRIIHAEVWATDTIPADEPNRIARHINKPNVKLPLAEVGWTKADCRRWRLCTKEAVRDET